jgi:hypothetical protein
MNERVSKWLDRHFADLVISLRELALVVFGFVMGLDVGASTLNVGPQVVRLQTWGIIGEAVNVSAAWQWWMSTSMSVATGIGVVLVVLVVVANLDKSPDEISPPADREGGEA